MVNMQNRVLIRGLINSLRMGIIMLVILGTYKIINRIIRILSNWVQLWCIVHQITEMDLKLTILRLNLKA